MNNFWSFYTEFWWTYVLIGYGEFNPDYDKYAPELVAGYSVEFKLWDWQFGAFHQWYDGPNCAWHFGPIVFYRMGVNCPKCSRGL